jgi:tetratricopeptide (TPR) repeat protein
MLALVPTLLVSAPCLARPDETLALAVRVEELVLAERYSEAEPLALRLLTILKQKPLGSNQTLIAYSLKFIGFVYAGEGRYADAEPLLRQSLEIDEKARSPNNVDYATLNRLAIVYENLGRFVDAEALYKCSLGIREKVFGPNDPTARCR